MAVSASLQIQSRLTAEGLLTLELASVPIRPPAADEVLIRVEAAPINPSDLGAMIGPADITRLRVDEVGNATRIVLPMPPQRMAALASRIGLALPAGIEGAGVVVEAGSSKDARALIGKVVAVSTGAMYTQYRVANIADLLVMYDGTTPVEAASSFINPLTALGMVETRRREGHMGIVHTAAASNLGQMLNRLCLADKVPLVNVVRTSAQGAILKHQGARYVLNSTSPDFGNDLEAAIEATGATLCFDAIGGGTLVSQILSAMERVQVTKLPGYQRYGSDILKQAYVYGVLDLRPIQLTRTFGSAWNIGGWLLTQFLARIGDEAAGRMRGRVAREITTTFASHYSQTISLREALDPAVIAAYHRRATGEKYLIVPHR